MSRILRFIYIMAALVGAVERILLWTARFGFLIYPLYGIISWVTAPRKNRLQRRAALIEAIFSVLTACTLSAVIRCIWHRPTSHRLRKLSRQLAYICTEAEDILRSK